MLDSFVDITRSQKTRLILFSVFVLFVNTAVFSETESPVLSLAHESHITKFVPQRAFEGDFGDRIKKEVAALKANNGSELLYSFDLYDSEQEKNLLEGLTDEELDLVIMQTLFSVDSQKGLQFYSSADKDYRAFISNTYRIESLKDKRPLENLRIDSLSDSILSFVFTKDSMYGDFVFNYDVYYDSKHTFYLTLANQQPVYFKSIFLVGPPNTLNTQYIIQRNGSKISAYGIAFSKINVPFKGIRVATSQNSLHKLFSILQWTERELKKNLNLLYTQNN